MDNMGNLEIRKVQYTSPDGSFSVVLPKAMCEKLGIGKGDYVKVSLHDKTLVVEKPKDDI